MEILNQTAQKAVDALLKAGADTAQCIVTESVTHEINADNGSFSLYRTLFDNSLSLMALVKHKKGSIFVNQFDDAAIDEAVANCIAVAESGAPDEAWEIAEKEENKVFCDGVIEPDMELFFDRFQELMRDISQRYPKIIVETAMGLHEKVNTVYTSSKGVHYERTCGCYGINLQYSAHDGEKGSSLFYSAFQTANLDKPFIECGSIAKDLADVERQIDTVALDRKFEGVMLVPPMCLSDFLMYALDSFAGDGGLLDGTSIWKDCLGKQIADSRITASMNPLDDRIVCGERYTGIGHLSENYDVIKNGVLENFMLSQYVANKIGGKRAPNNSSNIIVKNGDMPLEQMIQGIENGILVGRFSGGRPSSNGDFSGVAKNSFLIQNGKITHALSETMISGNLADMLKNVVAVSRETVCDGTSVLPYIAFRGITISGKT